MSTGQFALQSAIYTKLNSDSNLTSTLGAAVYDDRNFNIKHIRNVDERDRYLLLICNEGEAT